MNQKEFESRTGLNSTIDFEYANRVYMAAGQMNKDEFCEEWKKKSSRESNIISALTMEVEGNREAIHKLELQVDFDEENLRKYIDDFSYTLIMIAAGTADNETRLQARGKAIKLVGIKEYIRRRIELCCELDKEDLIALKDDILK